MPRTRPHADPLFWVNTDIKSYRKDHPDDKNGSAFFRFWLPEKAAYFTPEKDDTHDRVLATIEAGDPIFAYEDGVGILALGVVLEKPSLARCVGDCGPYLPSTEIVKRIDVEWDTTVNCSTSEVIVKTRFVRRTLQERGATRGSADDFLYELRERSSTWVLEAERAREEAAAAKARDIEQSALSQADQEAIRKARIGQGRYRNNLLRVEQRCRVTGIEHAGHLIASHIKPWTLCVGDEHWDGNNGFLLAPHVDHLFDKGRISFEDDGTLLISRFQDRSVLHAWALPEVLNVGAFNEEQRRYLKFHRDIIFERTRSWRALQEATPKATTGR